MSKLKIRNKSDKKEANYANFNVIDADGEWTSVNISFNADREYAEENFDAICEVLEQQLGVRATQDRPEAKRMAIKKPTK